MHWKNASDEEVLSLEAMESKGKEVKVNDVSMKQGETSPPEHLSESDLIEQVCSNLLC
jgi:DNA topoisomerase IA